MKYCLYCGQSKELLKQVDEIYYSAENINLLIEHANLYPDKTLIYQATNPNLNLLSQIPNVVLELENMNFAPECATRNIKFFYKYPICTYYDLNTLARLGVAYVRLGPPLFFDLPTVAQCKIPIRCYPNKAYDPLFPRTDAITGTWIRPEDLSLYEPYISVIEFDTSIHKTDNKLLTESTLYSIYTSGKWKGEISRIIPQLTIKVRNPLVFEGLGEKRLNCRHTCQRQICHFCTNAIKFGYVLQEKYINESQQRNHKLAKFETPNANIV